MLLKYSVFTTWDQMLQRTTNIIWKCMFKQAQWKTDEKKWGGCLTSGTCISVCVCVSVGVKMGSHIAQAKLERKDVLELLTLSPECWSEWQAPSQHPCVVWYWGLNPALYACWASTLPTSYIPCPASWLLSWLRNQLLKQYRNCHACASWGVPIQSLLLLSTKLK